MFKYTFAVNQTTDHEKLIEVIFYWIVKIFIQQEQCAICLGDFELDKDEKIYRTPCAHTFHSECLKQWGGKKLECPCCRKRLPDMVYPID